MLCVDAPATAPGAHIGFPTLSSPVLHCAPTQPLTCSTVHPHIDPQLSVPHYPTPCEQQQEERGGALRLRLLLQLEQ